MEADKLCSSAYKIKIMTKKISLEKIKQEIKKLIAEIGEVPEDKITEEAKFFEDLGIDSMKALEIAASIEKKYKVVIPEKEIPTIRSFHSVNVLVEKLLK
jgi:acyl carrier protein